MLVLKDVFVKNVTALLSVTFVFNLKVCNLTFPVHDHASVNTASMHALEYESNIFINIKCSEPIRVHYLLFILIGPMPWLQFFSYRPNI